MSKAKDYSPGVLMRMRHLKQFAGTSGLPDPSGSASSMVVREVQIPVLPSGQRQAEVAVSSLVRAVLDDHEYTLYISEVQQWMTAHPDWNLKEDIDDINGIAMEKVIQYRLMYQKKRRKSTDIEKDYNASVYRMQTFRTNLAARRADRLASKKPGEGGGGPQIAIIAGRLERDTMKTLMHRTDAERKEEDNLFPVIDITPEQGE